MHLIGAALAFMVGGMYCYLQTYMSFYMLDLPASTCLVRYVRLLASVGHGVMSIIGILYDDVILSRICQPTHLRPPARSHAYTRTNAHTTCALAKLHEM
jgi:hypothetical protein